MKFVTMASLKILNFENTKYGVIHIIHIFVEVRFVSCPPFFLRDDSRKLYHRVKIVFKII